MVKSVSGFKHFRWSNIRLKLSKIVFFEFQAKVGFKLNKSTCIMRTDSKTHFEYLTRSVHFAWARPEGVNKTFSVVPETSTPLSNRLGPLISINTTTSPFGCTLVVFRCEKVSNHTFRVFDTLLESHAPADLKPTANGDKHQLGGLFREQRVSQKLKVRKIGV